MAKQAVLISGELRFIEECLPTMTFIDDDVDVYVSTWDKVIIKDDVLEIDINEDVTEERIRKILPNATIIIEPLDCFEAKKYSDRMIHRWLVGWEAVKASGKTYSRVTVTRPDLYFFEPHVGKLNDNPVSLEVGWYVEGFLQDGIFSSSVDILDKIFSGLTVGKWHGAQQQNWHIWFYYFARDVLGDIDIHNFDAHFIFLRAGTARDNTEKLNYNSVMRRYFNWRTARTVSYGTERTREGTKFNNRILVGDWGKDEVEAMELQYRSGRLKRKLSNDTLVIFAGEVINYQSGALSLPVFGDCDVAVVSWNSEKSARFARIVNADHVHLFDEHNFKCAPEGLCPNGQKMMYLWNKCYEIFGKSEYKNIVFARPNVYIYVAQKINVREELDLSENGLLTFDWPNSPVAQDQLVTFKSDMWPVMNKINERIAELPELPGHHNDIHELLRKFFEAWGIENGSTTLHAKILDLVIQHDNFTYIMDEGYGKKFYLNVWGAAVTWWREHHGISSDFNSNAVARALQLGVENNVE